MEKKAIQEKVFLRFYFGTTINHMTHSVSKLCWSFYSFKWLKSRRSLFRKSKSIWLCCHSPFKVRAHNSQNANSFQNCENHFFCTFLTKSQTVVPSTAYYVHSLLMIYPKTLKLKTIQLQIWKTFTDESRHSIANVEAFETSKLLGDYSQAFSMWNIFYF